MGRNQWTLALLASAAFGLPTAAYCADNEALPASPEAKSDASEAALQAVTVTARRRPEDVQTVPESLSVVGGELLDRSYTVNTQEMSQHVPALNYSSANPRNTAFTIRGLGSSVVAVSQANDGLEPGVGYYVDQVYHARPATAAFDFSDIDHIEVLRGPQGTLFGKNSTAGAINIATRLPTFNYEAQGEVSVGGSGYHQVKLAVSGPLVEGRLAGRLSAVSTDRDGVIHNVVTGQNQNAISNQAVRGQLLFTPSEDLKVRGIADWSNIDSDCCTQVYVRVAPTLKAAARQYPALAAGLGYTPPSLNPYYRLTTIDAPLGVKTSEGGVAAIADWTRGAATLTSVSAWRYWNWDAANDRDYTGIPIQITQHIPSRQDQYSQELRIASNGDTSLSYVAGLYAFSQRVTGRPMSIYGPQATYWLLGPAPAFPANLLDGYSTDGHTDFRSESYAAFGEFTWKPTNRLSLTGGLRYTYEQKSGTYSTFVFGGLTGISTSLLNSQLSILRGHTYSATVDGGSPTGRANASWSFSDNVLGYAGFAFGTKSGGINMSGLPLTSANLPALNTAVVKPEQNTNYEVGLKSKLFDSRVILNLDAYYARVTDFQANVTDTGAAAALRTYLANIPEVTVKGVEADAIVAVSHDLSLRAAAAYTNGKYASYPNGPCSIERISSSTTVCDLTGVGLPGLPKWVVSLGADYSHPVDSPGGGEVVLHVDGSTRTKQYGDPTGSQYTIIGGYTVVNASVGFRSRKGWEVVVFAKNLFDADYIQNMTIQAGNSGLILGTPSDPRLVGVTFRVRH